MVSYGVSCGPSLNLLLHIQQELFACQVFSPVSVEILTAFYQSTSLILIAKEPAVLSINIKFFYTFENPRLRMDRHLIWMKTTIFRSDCLSLNQM